MERTVVGIDVGSEKVCTVVGELDDDGALSVIGLGLAPSQGIRKGVVVNVAEATAAILASVAKAERSSGYKVERAYVALSGTHVSSLNSRGVVGISGKEQGIAAVDVDRALDAARVVAVPHSQEVVHVIPRGYVVDGQSGVRDPVGMHGFRLEVEAHIVTGSTTAIQNLTKCVEGAGVEVDEFVLASIAAGGAVLTETEREMGVLLADIGSGITDIAVFIDGTVWHTVNLGIGGEYVTNDIAIGLRLPPTVAEQVKVRHGSARVSLVPPDEQFTVSPFGVASPQAVPYWKLAEIMEARVEEMLHMINDEIRRSGYDGLLPAGVVLCGGTAQIPGIRQFAGDILGLPVRVGRAEGISGLVEKMRKPDSAVSAGLLGWGMTLEARPTVKKAPYGTGGRFRHWLRALLPG